jgi:2-dehydro-3-deoxyglucarate aldolase/4-hydroxy-2-oxoheptanedioate aldolase
MMDTTFRTKLIAGNRLVGTVVSLPTPEVVELLAGLGFDWLFIDGEHGPIGIHAAQSMLQAAGSGFPCLVRVPVGNEEWLKKVLDLGATGVIVPQVHNAAQAEEVVRHCKYPPTGNRGVGVARAHAYGNRFGEYLAQANEHTTVVVQAESAEAVENIEAIVQVPGIDAILVGPFDLSASLGKTGQLTDPVVQSAIGAITQACLAAGVRLGAFGVDPAAVQPFVELGYTLIAVGLDTMFLSTSASETLSAVKKAPS